MNIPEGFWALCRRFHQDTFMFVEKSEAAVVDYLVRGLSASERRDLADFLDKELARPDANARLHAMWKRSQADFGFSERSNMVEFHKLIRQRL